MRPSILDTDLSERIREIRRSEGRSYQDPEAKPEPEAKPAECTHHWISGVCINCGVDAWEVSPIISDPSIW